MHWHDGQLVVLRVDVVAGCIQLAYGRDVEGARIDVGEDRLRARTEDGADGGEEAEGRCNDLVARANLKRRKTEPEGVGTAGAAYGVGGLAGVGGGGFEAGDFGAEDEALAVADGRDGGEDLVAQGCVVAAEVEHGDGLELGGLHLGYGSALVERALPL